MEAGPLYAIKSPIFMKITLLTPIMTAKPRVMATFNRMHTPNLIDGRSILLMTVFCIFRELDIQLGHLYILFIHIDVKLVLEWLAVGTAITTISYNVVKTFGEIRTFILDVRDRQKKKKEERETTVNLDQDQFD